MNVTVIIVTLNRPDCVRRCLDCLVGQERLPDQIIVVDASSDSLTRNVVSAFRDVRYLVNENGLGRMTASRNIGLKASTGSVVAFIDDDAFAHPGWLTNLVAAYTDPTIGAVGGRALNSQPGEESLGLSEIGLLKPNGELTGYFAADPGETLDVDHIMGCNMSFRREVLARLGGFREDYPGISGVREDSDMCLRVKNLDYRILFCPGACVTHLGAPQAQGSRFDRTYAFYAARNHVVMLMRNRGLTSSMLWRYLLIGTIKFGIGPLLRGVGSSLAHFFTFCGGTVSGFLSGFVYLVTAGTDPVRRDPESEELRRVLSIEAGTSAEKISC